MNQGAGGNKRNKKQQSGFSGTNSHSVEQPPSMTNKDNSSVSSLMKKIIAGTSTATGTSVPKTNKSNKDNMGAAVLNQSSNVGSQRSRNYKFKVGNSGMHLIGHNSTTVAVNH